MKIGIIAATGQAGQVILKEAITRGHDVTAIVRNASKLKQDVAVLERSIYDLSVDDLKPFDVVVNAFGAPLGEEQAHVDAGHALIQALKGSDTRAVIVGGAGSLYVDKDMKTKVMDTPDFPDNFLPTAKGQGRNLEELQQTSDIQWTFISPSAEFSPDGNRTGSYKVGKDHLMTNSADDSYISYADYAIAVLDEIEAAEHLNERFTVVGER
ncbi:NAD(P)-dependent oxidoreductase [Marinilactibacillus kalidii]|uniref:NAD(P)-dependent oxidoreductase n=1 Tax=Marinilactibacillus kalidii TaxID=2820274 RepID=UPI001ABE3263|nr:NAD(P)-dependent oxidoreductase [Marinilactibacillus kalidii]